MWISYLCGFFFEIRVVVKGDGGDGGGSLGKNVC